MQVFEILKQRFGELTNILANYEEVNEVVDYIPHNTRPAVELLHKAVFNKRKIAIHADIDMDGYASAFAVRKFIRTLDMYCTCDLVANKQKTHGITEAHVEYINKKGYDITIVVDSSSNDIEIIKKLNCDCLVIDHHEITGELEQLRGNTASGEYVVVTNMTGDCVEPDLSGCAVAYYLIAEFCKTYELNIMQNMRLEQWVGLSLFSDVVALANRRNQYFVGELCNKKEIEHSLFSMINAIGSHRIDKNIISYKIVPLINSAIRAGASGEALSILMEAPGQISQLERYKIYQQEVVKYAKAVCQPVVLGDCLFMDLSDVEIHPNYCGVIAADAVGANDKCAYVFKLEGDKCVGSFRGLKHDTDYRGLMESLGARAAGHKAAFGLTIDRDRLEDTLKQIDILRSENEDYISIGEIQGGIAHFDCITDLRANGGLMTVANVNARLSPNECIEIKCKIPQLDYVQRGKVLVYNYDSVEFISFEPLKAGEIVLYPESSSSFGVSLFAKKV